MVVFLIGKLCWVLLVMVCMLLILLKKCCSRLILCIRLISSGLFDLVLCC